ncbi:MAG: hypothetical protein AUK35_01560 [Zetaproteobacteria bacterium CG2_30_46_52]|nr:MAG: hypothetical protein AUK35_01560 [Zetaproteobacteria bacterium CG2_30_46_52]
MISKQSHLPVAILMKLAWRNIWRHRKRTLITLSSIAIGFALAVLMIGLGDGGHNSLIRNAIKLGEGHITVQPSDYQQAPGNHKFLAHGASLSAQLQDLHIPGSIEPRIALQVLASSATNAIGAGLEGLGAGIDQRALMLQPSITHGYWLEADDIRGIIIGDGMARKLKVSIGSKVVIMAGKQGGDSQSQLARVRGIFDSKIEALDDYLMLCNISLARLYLVGEGADASLEPVTRFALYLDDPNTMEHVKHQLQTALEDKHTVVLDWQQMMPDLVQFIIVDDAGNYVFLMLILIMVVFGILNTVLMSVLERTREFGLLRALGLSRRYLLLLVFCESLLLSAVAVGLGWLFGGAVHLWFSTYGLDITAMMGGNTAMMGTFMDPVIYTELSWSRITQLTLIIFTATLGSGIYPAIKAARVTPVEALR